MPDQQGPSEPATIRGSVIKKKTNHANPLIKSGQIKQEPEVARLILMPTNIPDVIVAAFKNSAEISTAILINLVLSVL